MATTNGTLLSRGLALVRALTTAPATPINPPVEFPDHYADEAPGQDEPTPEEWAEIEELRNESAARDFLDTGDRLTLAELVDRQTDFYRGWGNPAGAMLAAHMEELALRVRWVQATTPQEYEDRKAIVDEDARQTWLVQGYEEGLAAGRREATPYDGPLD
jgi:hypothetical protein